DGHARARRGTGSRAAALSLRPDYHLCVIPAKQIVGIVPEAITALVPRSSQPLTFISGPSTTSDVELQRVEGVHGPHTRAVLVVQHPPGGGGDLSASDVCPRSTSDQS